MVFNQPSASEIINRLNEKIPGAVQLAQWLSLAARIEPELIRQVRLSLLPWLTATAEADLFFSPIVSQRSSDWIILSANIAEELRKNLKRKLKGRRSDKNKVEFARALLKQAHLRAPAEIILEEEIIWISVKQPGGKGRAIKEIDTKLWGVLVHLFKNTEDSLPLARWSASSSDRLPELINETAYYHPLLLAASSLLDGRRISAGKRIKPGAFRNLAPYLPESTKRIDVWAALTIQGLDFQPHKVKGYERIELPLTDPLLVEVKAGSGKAQVVYFNRFESQLVPVQSGSVEVKTLLRDIYRFRPKKKVSFVRQPFDLKKEKQAIDHWFERRQIPESRSGRLLLASWNITNLGTQKREMEDLQLIAHILAHFDLIALQEIKDDFSHLQMIVEEMGDVFDWIVSEVGGNNERLGFVYRKQKVSPLSEFGDIAIPEKDFPSLTVAVPYKIKKQERVEVFYNLRFTPFDLNPFLGTFESGDMHFTLVNVHLYFGDFREAEDVATRARYARRVLEAYTLGKWAKSRASRSTSAYDKNIIIMGEMNVPAMSNDDAAYQALLKSGLKPIDAISRIGRPDQDKIKNYHQLAITSPSVPERTLGYGVFDFDNAVFSDSWTVLNRQFGSKTALAKFNKYVKSHISDHRPIWMELATG